MYPDPNRVRSHRIAISLNKYEHDVIQSFSNLIGIDKSALAREMMMREAQRMLLERNVKQGSLQNPVTNQ